jgi:hypothetical protein
MSACIALQKELNVFWKEPGSINIARLTALKTVAGVCGCALSLLTERKHKLPHIKRQSRSD